MAEALAVVGSVVIALAACGLILGLLALAHRAEQRERRSRDTDYDL